jgi:deoxyribonuclease V
MATARVSPIAPYRPGAFYRRELPVLLAALQAAAAKPNILVVDGYVSLDPEGRPGLGARLAEAWGGTIVVGVAKTPLHGDDWSSQVLRGGAKRPLYVTTFRMRQEEAAMHVASMAGAHRIPDLLRLADRLARDGVNA